MKIIKLNSNECGGFRPPKGHLDTQMYPECKGTPTDRDVVKKTVDKRKKKKKKASMEITAKHSVIVEDIWNAFRNGTMPVEKFIANINSIFNYGPEKLSKDPATRKGIQNALEEVKRTRDYAQAAERISAALSMSSQTEEAFYAGSNDIIKEAQHGWPVKTHDDKGIWQRWENEEIDDKQFVDKLLELSKISGFPGLSHNNLVRDAIVKILNNFESSKDYSSTALTLNMWFKASEEMDDDPVQEQLIASSKKKIVASINMSKKAQWGNDDSYADRNNNPSSPYETTMELWNGDDSSEIAILVDFSVSPTEYEGGYLLNQGGINIEGMRTDEEFTVEGKTFPVGTDIEAILPYWVGFEEGKNNFVELSDRITDLMVEGGTNIPERNYKSIR